MTRRRLRLFAISLGTLTLLAALPLGALYLGRRIAWFDIDRVEVSGASLITPDAILRQSGITPGQSMFDDSDTWEEALRRHPVVVEVRISRRFPSTLEVQVLEKDAVALLAGEVLALATREGEVLPVDPAAAPRDLPIVIVEAADSIRAELERRLLAETGRLAELDPELVSALSMLRLTAAEPQVVQLQHAAGEILLPLGASALRLAELRSVLADLAMESASAVVRPSGSSTMASSGGDLPAGSPPVIDLRFEGQVVVRHPLPREIS